MPGTPTLSDESLGASKIEEGVALITPPVQLCFHTTTLFVSFGWAVFLFSKLWSANGEGPKTDSSLFIGPDFGLRALGFGELCQDIGTVSRRVGIT